MNKKIFTAISVGAVFAASVFLSCTKEETNVWDNGSQGGSNFANNALKFTVGMRDAALQNGTLEKDFQGISGWSINIKWLEEYNDAAEEIVVETVGNLPGEILNDCQNGDKTIVNLLIRSPGKYDSEGATPISDWKARASDNATRGVNISQHDIDVLTAKFQEKLGNCVTVVPNTDDDNMGYPPLPEINPDIPQRPENKMFFQFNNKTNQYPDDQIYICILGLKLQSEGGGGWHYVDKDGQMIRVAGRPELLPGAWPAPPKYTTDISFKLSDGLGSVPGAKYLYMPNIESGRMFISYGQPISIGFVYGADNNLGFAGPDVNNPGDPNYDTYFEFIEFTIEGQYHGNTTRVDFFSFPIVTSLHGRNGIKTVGEIGTRAQLYAAWQTEVPNEFKSLAENIRILAPAKRTFNEGGPNAHYFDAYVDELWNKWRNGATFNCGDAGIMRGTVGSDNVLRMVRDGHVGNPDWGDIVIRKPNTQEVFEGKGALDDGSQGSRVGSLATQAQVCAAINRGVAHLDEWNNASQYYVTDKPANHYSKFWHDHSIGAHAYGFCYDDVFDHATLLYDPEPVALVIDLKW